uniref:Chromosome transmission fidelity factor 18 n=1 Tax=Malurus cyaneus samueli TaxID=2593467 RepID=A0A8C5TU08_9PASS
MQVLSGSGATAALQPPPCPWLAAGLRHCPVSRDAPASRVDGPSPSRCHSRRPRSRAVLPLPIPTAGIGLAPLPTAAAPRSRQLRRRARDRGGGDRERGAGTRTAEGSRDRVEVTRDRAEGTQDTAERSRYRAEGTQDRAEVIRHTAERTRHGPAPPGPAALQRLPVALTSRPISAAPAPRPTARRVQSAPARSASRASAANQRALLGAAAGGRRREERWRGARGARPMRGALRPGEDEFYERFADELEVLAELGGGRCCGTGTARHRPPHADRRRRREGVCGRDRALRGRTRGRALSLLKELVFPSSNPMEVSGMSPLQTTPPLEKKRVLRRPPILEDYINVTSSEGTRVFLVLRDDLSRTGVEVRRALEVGPLHLLGVPFSYLKEQVDAERRRQVLEASHCLESEPSAESPDASMDMDPAAQEESTSHCLWVDKFMPRRYMELLSDDYTNRCLLKWLKLWDTVVFGKDKSGKKPKPGPTAHPPFSHHKEHPNKWKTKVQLTEELLEAELDQHKRPKYKVALLCGPPGLGKTTLAHVIARHAGYNAVEMNCDRSPRVFRTRIEARPNCLIIDEIDGAPAVSPALSTFSVNPLNLPVSSSSSAP